MDARRLIALDEDDLAVISTHVQDSALRVGEIRWRPAEKRLVLGINRMDLDEIVAGKVQCRKLVSALRFDRVLACQSRGIDMTQPGIELHLLGLEFHPGAAPGGTVALLFGSGGVLRLEVECLECELADLGLAEVSTAVE